MKKTYIKRGIWHLGDRKKNKKEDFYLFLGHLLDLLVPAAGAVDGEVLKGLGKKVLGREKEDLESEDKG